MLDERAVLDVRLYHRSLLLVAAVTIGGCGGGGGSSPTASTPLPTPSPSPTPRPRVAFTLTATADHFQYSASLTQLQIGQSFDVTVRPIELNRADGQGFGNAVELWLMRSSSADTVDYVTDGFGFSLVWSRDSTWAVSHRQPGVGYTSTALRVEMALGEPHEVRVVRLGDGQAQYLFDGGSVLVLPDSSSVVEHLFARVVGTRAEFSYVPGAASSGGRQLSAHGPVEACGPCGPAGPITAPPNPRRLLR